MKRTRSESGGGVRGGEAGRGCGGAWGGKAGRGSGTWGNKSTSEEPRDSGAASGEIDLSDYEKDGDGWYIGYPSITQKKLAARKTRRRGGGWERERRRFETAQAGGQKGKTRREEPGRERARRGESWRKGAWREEPGREEPGHERARHKEPGREALRREEAERPEGKILRIGFRIREKKEE